MKIKKEKLKIITGIFGKSMGLRFRKSFGDYEGLLFKSKHREFMVMDMFFCFFPIKIAWIDDDFKILQYTIAKPFRIYAPKKMTKMVIELPVHKEIRVGEKIEII